MEAGLSIGSNLGNRLANLKAARTAILSIRGVTELAASPVYQTEPVGVAKQDLDKPFLNSVLVIDFGGDAAALGRELAAVETKLGRVRAGARNEPRVIDIDVIYAGKTPFGSESLVIPHPRWTQRRFVVQPLADVRPDLVIHGQTRTVREVLLSLPAQPKVILCERQW